MIDINVWTVGLAAGTTAVATGLGALPFLSVRDFSDRWLGVFNDAAGAIIRMVFAELIPRRAGRGIGCPRWGGGDPRPRGALCFLAPWAPHVPPGAPSDLRRMLFLYQKRM